MDLKKEIREIPDFPKEGINFKDLTTLFKNKEAFRFVVDSIVRRYKEKGITKVAGLEARGFIVGGVLANELGAGFIPVRKAGRLPAETIQESYGLEYGEDNIEIHIDAINENDVVLIHDDLLATGGTAHAALKLIERLGAKKIYFSFICDLEFIETPEKDLIKRFDTQILVKY